MPLFTVTMKSYQPVNEKDPNNILVFFLETDHTSGSFGGGQFAPPIAFV